MTLSELSKLEFFRLRNEAGASSGIVGYNNLSLPRGFSMIANQFYHPGGANDVATLLAEVPDGTTLYMYSDNGFTVNTYFEGWDVPGQTLAPGGGGFLVNPGEAPLSIILCGNVGEGDQLHPIPADFSIISLLTPQERTTEQLGLPAADGDTIYQWKGNGYEVNGYFDGWDAPQRVVQPGEAFWYRSSTAKQWRQIFDNVD